MTTNLTEDERKQAAEANPRKRMICIRFNGPGSRNGVLSTEFIQRSDGSGMIDALQAIVDHLNNAAAGEIPTVVNDEPLPERINAIQ